MIKHIFVLFMLTMLSIPSGVQAQEEDQTTVYYFIRHAEKDRSDPANKNPSLTQEGRDRAQNWKSIFMNTGLDMVYSTQYNRTIETATPLAEANKLEIQFYNPRQLYSDDFKAATAGKQVLVVGHSNTTPAFVNAVLGKITYGDVADDNNGKLFIVTIINGVSSVEVFQID